MLLKEINKRLVRGLDLVEDEVTRVGRMESRSRKEEEYYMYRSIKDLEMKRSRKDLYSSSPLTFSALINYFCTLNCKLNL